jgi:hypothetical protein
MYAKKRRNTSNRLTSFDRRFTACPTVVLHRAVLLNFNAWNYIAKLSRRYIPYQSWDERNMSGCDAARNLNETPRQRADTSGNCHIRVNPCNLNITYEKRYIQQNFRLD